MSLNKKIVDITRELRRQQTPEETELWEKLRNRKLNDLKFLRQHPIVYEYKDYTPLFFVADFYCAEKKLVVELDGNIHDFQKDYDENRDSVLRDLGLQVLRIRNEELENHDNVLKKILETANSTHPPSPSLHSREGVVERSETGGEFERGKLESGKGGELAIIILAAGPSSRMGQSKQQLLIDGKSLLTKAVETALQSNVKNVVVVLGSQEESHKEDLKGIAVETIFNSRWKAGMGNSLKAGLNHVISGNSKIEAIIVMVCDQPLLKPDHLQLLIERYRKTKALIVASGYSNTSGVPALFNYQLFDEILKLDNDQGAKKIIQQHSAEVIDFPEGAIDLDTPEDYQSFIQKISKKIS